jgi:hypothetical protein
MSMNKFIQTDDKPRISSRTTIRRLSLIKSFEGKTRIIAILDYWSQTVLKPLHN